MRPRRLMFPMLAVLTNCGPDKNANWPTDPKTETAISVDCQAANETLSRLGCVESRKDFADICVYYVSKGIPLHPQCIAAAKTCADVDKC